MIIISPILTLARIDNRGGQLHEIKHSRAARTHAVRTRADAGRGTCRKASSFASLAALLTPMAWKGAELFEEYIIIVIESAARGRLDQKAVQRLLFSRTSRRTGIRRTDEVVASRLSSTVQAPSLCKKFVSPPCGLNVLHREKIHMK